jgi:hypothetical protein
MTGKRGFIWEIYRWLNKQSQNSMDVCGRKTWCSDNVREMLSRKTGGGDTRPGIYIHVYVYKP